MFGLQRDHYGPLYGLSFFFFSGSDFLQSLFRVQCLHRVANSGVLPPCKCKNPPEALDNIGQGKNVPREFIKAGLGLRVFFCFPGVRVSGVGDCEVFGKKGRPDWGSTTLKIIVKQLRFVHFAAMSTEVS